MHLSTLARRLGSVALVAGLGLGATACSEDSSSGTDAESSETSSETSPETSSEESTDPSAEPTSDESTDPSADESTDDGSEATAPEELSAADFYPTVMGALRDAETFSFESTTSTNGQQSTITGQARYADSGMEMKATSSGAQSMELIMLDQVIYMQAPQMGLGDKWMKIDLRAGGDSLLGMLAKATDPEAMFKAMETPKKLELVGSEEVDGVETNHYRITMDPKQYIKAMGLPAQMSSFLPDELVTEMWVDGDGLPRKFAQTVETPGVGGGETTTSTTEGFYSDFGTDVEIKAPPASETTDAPALPGSA